MKAEIPKSIELTTPERKLLSRIRFDVDQRTGKDRQLILESCNLAYDLMQSLREREAIPKARWDFATSVEHNVGVSRSRLGVIQRNSRQTGSAVFREPSFLDNHLRYLLSGPQLPAETIAGFCRIVNESLGTSGMVISALRQFARAEIRKRSLNKDEACEQFYLLALEAGPRFSARSIRDAAKSVRRQ